MTRNRLKYLRNEAIEDITAQRIREYEAKAGVTVKLPVPVEEIVEQVLDLDFDWDIIDEKPGEQILGGLDAVNRNILLNEAHTDLFDEKPDIFEAPLGMAAAQDMANRALTVAASRETLLTDSYILRMPAKLALSMNRPKRPATHSAIQVGISRCFR
jgi:hypothetical protein